MRSSRRHTLILLLLDAIAVFAVFNLISWLRGVQPWGAVIGWPLAAPYLLLAGCVYLIDGYRARTELMSLDYASRHLLANGAALLATLLLTYVIIPANFPLQGSRTVIALSFVALTALTLSYRRSLHRWEEAVRDERCILFLGDRANGEAFRQTCTANGLRQRVLCGLTGGTAGPTAAAPDPWNRPAAEVVAEVVTGQLDVEAIVLPESARELDPVSSDHLVELYFQGVPTFTLELFYETYWRKIPLDRINQTWLFQEGFQIARNPVFQRAKRVLDAVIAAVTLFVVSPLLLFVALGIRAADGGPAFYTQWRVGRNRRPFLLVKLRTMRIGADAEPEAPAPGEVDPRVTRLGRYLRATRLDEVPQLWNVLKGEMSLIGPRAEWKRLVEGYENQIPCYHFRHLVRPGITGWAQVNRPHGRGLADTRHKLEYDLYYIRHFSFRIDASIVLKTIHVMLFGKGR
jgi:exopolysaccharide biosynthesis polyprenyl glycosylphosphotransferase